MDAIQFLKGGSRAVGAGVGAVSYLLSSPDEADAMYVGPKAVGWDKLTGKFSSLMDRMQRAEISDAGAMVNMSRIPDNPYSPLNIGITLPEVVSHEELYRQYPFLRDVKIMHGNMQGERASWMPGRTEPVGTISVNKSEAQTSDIFHEIQHAIQEKEGWARGGNPGSSASIYGEMVLDANKRLQKIGKMESFAIANGKLDKAAKELGASGYSDEGFKKYDTVYRSVLKDHPEYEEYHDLARFIYKKPESGIDVYKRLSGEIEARDTAARMGLTSAQRASTAPYAGQGIPLKDTITKMGVAAPVGAVLAEQLAQKRALEAKEALVPAINPVEYLTPARWGGGVINFAIDYLLQ